MDFWHLSHSEWFDILDEDAKRTLNEGAVEVFFEKNQMVFAPEPEPACAYLLLSGLISIYRVTLDGDQMTMGFVRPGQLFGELAIVGGEERETFATALSTSLALKIPKRRFLTIMKNCNPAALYVSKTIANESVKFQRRLEHLVFKSVRARLANVFLEMAEDFGKTRNGALFIDAHLTQTEYAQLIGASRPSVNIVLNEFQHDGEIERRPNGIVILDLDGLKRIALEDVPRRSRRRGQKI